VRNPYYGHVNTMIMPHVCDLNYTRMRTEHFIKLTFTLNITRTATCVNILFRDKEH